VPVPCRVRVPQPALYVAQKILARSAGRAARVEKSAKDLAYTYLKYYERVKKGSDTLKVACIELMDAALGMVTVGDERWRNP
jgi:hypothetical protein